MSEEYKPYFPYWDIGTQLTETYTDEKLLMFIANAPITEAPGYGLVAELCKRYAREKAITKEDVMSASFGDANKEVAQ